MDTHTGLVAPQEAARKRRFSKELKARIVAETYQPGSSISIVARRYDINANLLFHWRKMFRDEIPTSNSTPLPVTIATGSEVEAASCELTPGTLEIRVSEKRILTRGTVDVAALRAAIEALAS